MQEIIQEESSPETEADTTKPQGQAEEKSEETKYSEADVLTFVRVRFPGNAKSFPFLSKKNDYHYGQKVLAMSDRGMTVGYINSFPYIRPFKKTMLPLRSIARAANDEDLRELLDNIQREKQAENSCKKLIDKYKLDMIITHVEFIQFGKKAVFYFNAPARIDFRELVKELVKDLKIRIELRQISVRDRTAALGGAAACGRQTCCSSFLKDYGNTNIKMAKNQNLALIPGKINGICGQIKCCTKYEDHIYTQKRGNLPKETTFVKLANGDVGKVLKLNVLEETFDLLTDKGAKRRYDASQYDRKDGKPVSDWKFPTRFDNITNETSIVIGEIKIPKPMVNEQFVTQRIINNKDEAREELEHVEKTETTQQKKTETNPETKVEKAPEKTELNSKDQPKENRNRNRNRNRNKAPTQQQLKPGNGAQPTKEKVDENGDVNGNSVAGSMSGMEKGPTNRNKNKSRNNNRNRNRNRNRNGGNGNSGNANGNPST